MKEKVFYIILAIVFFLATASLAHAWTDAEGFLGLKWGMSEEEARKVFNDLKLKDKRSESPDVLQPWNGYVRENESFKLGDLPPDEVTYLFTEKGFDAVIARIGFYDFGAVPGRYEKLKEEYATSYEIIKKNLVIKYGAPRSDVNFVSTWKVAETNILLSFGSNDLGKNYLNLVLCFSYKPKGSK